MAMDKHATNVLSLTQVPTLGLQALLLLMNGSHVVSVECAVTSRTSDGLKAVCWQYNTHYLAMMKHHDV